MSQTNTNTNTNTGADNTYWHQNPGRDRQDKGGSGNKSPGGRGCDRGSNSIAKYLYEGKLNDDCLSKLTITKSGHQATQFKKIIDTLPLFCTYKN